jgi:hypothetical protein
MSPIPLTNITERLPFPDDSLFGNSDPVVKRSFRLIFESSPFCGTQFLRLARKHGDIS